MGNITHFDVTYYTFKKHFLGLNTSKSIFHISNSIFRFKIIAFSKM